MGGRIPEVFRKGGEKVELHGLHHVTAVTGHASKNVRFYTQVLGLRLVKKTVNQDDVSAYHLFYGDERGSPGTELTFFDWPYVGPAVPGMGTISAIGLRVAVKPRYSGGRAASMSWECSTRRFPPDGTADRSYDLPTRRANNWSSPTTAVLPAALRGPRALSS